MKVLVTGGAGMIGSHLVDRLLERGDEVRVLDNLDRRVHPDGERPDYLPAGIGWIHGDIRDPRRLREALAGADAVVHLAAIVGGLQSQYRNQEYIDVGLGGTALLIDLLIHEFRSVKRIVVASSGSIYGEGKYGCPDHGIFYPSSRSEKETTEDGWDVRCPACGGRAEPIPVDELSPPRPLSTYAIVKKGQEDLVLNFGRTFGRHAAALRFFSVYGPRQSMHNPYSGVLSIFANRLLNGLPPVLYEDGRQLRDFVSVHDAVSAVLSALQRPDCSGEAINVAGGTPKTIGEVSAVVARALGSEHEPAVRPQMRRGDVRHCLADLTKADRLLGYRPAIPFDEGVRALVSWAMAHPSADVFEIGAGELERHGIAS